MDVQVLHHVSLPVADLERSRRFYREVLGLEEIERAPLPGPGAWFRLGGRELHLVAGEAEAVRGAEGPDPRRLHFAVRVASYRAALERLRARGYREDAGEGDPGRVLALPRSVVGYPQLYCSATLSESADAGSSRPRTALCSPGTAHGRGDMAGTRRP